MLYELSRLGSLVPNMIRIKLLSRETDLETHFSFLLFLIYRKFKIVISTYRVLEIIDLMNSPISELHNVCHSYSFRNLDSKSLEHDLLSISHIGNAIG